MSPMTTSWRLLIMGPVLVAGFFNARPTRLLRPYLASLSATSSATGSDLAQLGLSSGASASEIKRAYHTAVLTIHPDRNTSDVAKVEFLKVTQAYQTLMAAHNKNRGNRGFAHLYRHPCLPLETPRSDLELSALEYLAEAGGISPKLVAEFSQSFPVLATLDTAKQVAPLMRFLMGTLCEGSSEKLEEVLAASTLPPEFFGSRLERTLAPRHAFLASLNLPHGYALISPRNGDHRHGDDFTLKQMLAKRSPADFTALCNHALASRDYHSGSTGLDGETSDSNRDSDGNSGGGDSCSDSDSNRGAIDAATSSLSSPRLTRVTAADVKAFEDAFGRGLLAASRREGNFWPLEGSDELEVSESESTEAAQAERAPVETVAAATEASSGPSADVPLSEEISGGDAAAAAAPPPPPPPITRLRVAPHEMVSLLMAHGADATERDRRGVSLVHHACGAGQWQCAEALAKALGERAAATLIGFQDHATPLHWAACGIARSSFGGGGHRATCAWLLERGADPGAATADGNTVLMWAAWGGNLEVVQLLVNTGRANLDAVNQNGCGVAHWAAGGGHDDVCKWLHDACGVDFTLRNFKGSTPLSKAVAHGQGKLAQWLATETNAKDDKEGVEAALELAAALVHVTNDNPMRAAILKNLQNGVTPGGF